MVNTTVAHPVRSGRPAPLVGVLVGVYVAVVVATLAALAIMSAVGSGAATPEAWGHAIIVAVFAVLLPLRLRSARRGSGRAWRAVGIIAVVLLGVNAVEAALPDLFPGWMRIEMVGIAALMVGVVLTVVRAKR